jgi:hypothetical protein
MQTALGQSSKALMGVAHRRSSIFWGRASEERCGCATKIQTAGRLRGGGGIPNSARGDPLAESRGSVG